MAPTRQLTPTQYCGVHSCTQDGQDQRGVTAVPGLHQDGVILNSRTLGDDSLALSAPSSYLMWGLLCFGSRICPSSGLNPRRRHLRGH